MANNALYTLSPTEVRKLLLNCQSLRERIIVRLMVHCGLRREEVAKLKVENFDLANNRINFIGKFQIPGKVPAPASLIQDVKFFIAGRTGGYLFESRKRKGRPLANCQINRIVTTVGQRAGIRNPNPKSQTGHINPHLLRHTFARIAKDTIGDLESVQILMRHASFKTTYDNYGRISFDRVQERYEEAFGG